jgi:Holliday junction resolvase RusA-like endonuclease
MIRITIPGRAVPWSVQAVTRRGRSGKSFAALTSKPTVADYRALVKQLVWQAVQEAGWEAEDGPLALTLVVWRQAPKSRPKRRALTPRESYPCSKPDCTNYQKLAEDAGKALLWDDDSRIVHVQTLKLYAPPGHGERLEIHVRRVEETPGELWFRVAQGSGCEMGPAIFEAREAEAEGLFG